MYKTVLIWTWLHWLDIHVIFYHITLNKPVLFSEMDASRAVQPARLALMRWQGHLHLHLHLISSHLHLHLHHHLHFHLLFTSISPSFSIFISTSTSISISPWLRRMHVRDLGVTPSQPLTGITSALMYSLMKDAHTWWFWEFPLQKTHLFPRDWIFRNRKGRPVTTLYPVPCCFDYSIILVYSHLRWLTCFCQ